MSHKLYISALVLLFGLGAIAVLFSTIFAVHDSREYQALPEAYRAAIGRLRECLWRYSELPEDDQKALLAQHKRWKNEERLLLWEMEELDLGPKQQPVTPAIEDVHDRIKKDAALMVFKRLVPQWGGALHQQRPIRAIVISLFAFLPVILLVGLVKWLALASFVASGTR